MEQIGFCKVSFESLASSFDYEFLNSDTNELKSCLKSAKKIINNLREINCFYFREFDNDCFTEVITGRSFKPIYLEDKNLTYYYNRESGLYILPKTMHYASKKESLNGMNNKEYCKKVNKFFNTFINVENKDNILVSKAQKMLLLQKKKIVE